MKKFLKKFGVLFLALITLVSCSKYNSDKTFEYNSLEELNNALKNAVIFDETDKTGIYTVDLDNTTFRDNDIKYYLHTRLWKDDNDKSTKEAPYISPDHLVVEIIITITDEDKKKHEYYILSKHCYESDFYTESKETEDDKMKLEIADYKKIYRKVKNSVRVHSGKKDFIYVTSNEPKSTLIEVTKQIAKNLKFVKFSNAK